MLQYDFHFSSTKNIKQSLQKNKDITVSIFGKQKILIIDQII